MRNVRSEENCYYQWQQAQEKVEKAESRVKLHEQSPPRSSSLIVRSRRRRRRFNFHHLGLVGILTVRLESTHADLFLLLRCPSRRSDPSQRSRLNRTSSSVNRTAAASGDGRSSLVLVFDGCCCSGSVRRRRGAAFLRAETGGEERALQILERRGGEQDLGDLVLLEGNAWRD